MVRGLERGRVNVAARGGGMFAALLLAAALAHPLRAQDAAAAADTQPRTGNAWIDARLLDMDAYAARYRDAFVDEIVRYHEAPRALVEEALADGAMGAGDVYFACALAQAIGRPCRAVVDAWRADHEDGWGGVMERLGVASRATSPERRIRDDITASYRRWARPIDADAPSRK